MEHQPKPRTQADVFQPRDAGIPFSMGMERRINIPNRKVCFGDSVVRHVPRLAPLFLILLSASVFQFATPTIAQSNELIVNGASSYLLLTAFFWKKIVWRALPPLYDNTMWTH